MFPLTKASRLYTITLMLMTSLFTGCIRDNETAASEEYNVTDTAVSKEAGLKSSVAKLMNVKAHYSQDKLPFYSRFLVPEQTGIPVLFEDDHLEHHVTYLGLLSSKETNKSFYVVSHFKRIGVGAMDAPRGRSTVAFVNLIQDEIFLYSPSMPEDLPTEIKDNMLCFNVEVTSSCITLDQALLPYLCIPEVGCFD